MHITRETDVIEGTHLDYTAPPEKVRRALKEKEAKGKG
jgi:hypothetical protein